MGTLHCECVGLEWRNAARYFRFCCFMIVLSFLQPFAASRPGSGVHSADHWVRVNGLSTLVTADVNSQKEKVDLLTSDLFPVLPSKKPSERRALFNGVGSAPPQCYFKCGNCNPCNPVHVPIQPGLVKTTEYYPEAWRCKCGQKLFMP